MAAGWEGARDPARTTSTFKVSATDLSRLASEPIRLSDKANSVFAPFGATCLRLPAER